MECPAVILVLGLLYPALVNRSTAPARMISGNFDASWVRKHHSRRDAGGEQSQGPVLNRATIWGRAREVARAFREAPEVDVTWALVAFVALLADPGFGWDNGELSPAAFVLAGVTSLPLVVRRRYPLAALIAVTGGLLACLAVFHPNIAAVGVLMLALYNVGLQGRRLHSLLVGAAMAPIVTAAVAITSADGLTVGTPLARLPLLLLALAAGDARRGRLALVEARAEEAEQRHEAAAVHRFDEERLRLAHELHDTVGHALVGINVQAAAAVHLHRRRQPDDNLEALEDIVRSSADALGELRSTLKLIRASADDAPMHPAQSLTDLPGLIEGVRASGVDVQVDLGLDPVPDDLPPAIAHAAYRIVQESLTNVLRHSSAKRAVVRLTVVADRLTVEVLDDGEPSPREPAPPGQGVLGMNERAAALGGHCEAGVAPGGGWVVRASLPATTAHP